MNMYKKCLKIIAWNIRGLVETVDGLRANKLQIPEIIKELSKYDIVFLQETHLHENSDEFVLPGFSKPIHYYRQKRGKAWKASGGISVLIKEELRQHVRCLPKSNSDLVWLEFKADNDENDTLYIASTYIPPENSSYGRDHTGAIWDRLQSDVDYYATRGKIIVCGDLNARTGSLEDFITMDRVSNHYHLPPDYTYDNARKRISMDKTVTKYGKHFVEMCLNNRMTILNGRTLGDLEGKYTCHTPQGSSVVDYLACSQSITKDIVNMKVKNLTSVSDHCPIELALYISLKDATKPRGKKDKNNQQSNNTGETEINETSAQRFFWDTDSDDKYRQAFHSQDIVNLIKSNLQQNTESGHNKQTVNDKADTLSQVLLEAAKISLKRIPQRPKCRKTSANNNKKWFDQDCRSIRREVKSLLNALNRRADDPSLTAKYYSKRKLYNRLVRKKKAQFKNKLVENLNSAIEKDPNAVWKSLRELREADKPLSQSNSQLNSAKWLQHLEDIVGQEVEIDQKRKAEIEEQLNQAEKDRYFSNLDYQVSHNEILRATKSLKNKKAAGIDGITNEMIKNALPHIRENIKNCFNAVLSSGIYPQSWKTGVSVAIHKSGDPTSPNNYRGITLTSAMGKLFCQVMNTRITDFLEDNKLLAPEQAGFRRSHRTSDHIIILKTVVDKYMKSNSGRLYCCFVDLQKAFDNVWHTAMLLKLQQIGVTGLCYNIIKDMYSNATVCTKTATGYSPEITLRKGVQQGNNISPTIFNVFVNDIPEHLSGADSPTLGTTIQTQLPCLLYADDLVILSTSKTGLQTKLNSFNKYCSEWGLTVNKSKTKIMIFSKHKPKVPVLFYFNDNLLETTNTYKYLGVVFNCEGSFLSAQDHLHKQANKAAHEVRRTVFKQDIAPEITMKLYDSLVVPVATYASEVWLPYISPMVEANGACEKIFDVGTKGQLNFEAQQIKFIKAVLGVNKKAMNLPALGELGRFPISMKIVSQMIGYWSHVTESDSDSHLKKAYEEQIYTSATWTTWVKNIMYSLGLGHVWENQSTFSPQRLKTTVQNMLLKKFTQYWEQKINLETSKLQFYKGVVQDFRAQAYIQATRNRHHRQALTKLRISAHTLEIERGRYRNVPRENRLCSCCDVVEDELHFLDKCRLYNKARQRLNQQTDCSKPSDLLVRDDQQPVLAKYVYNCFQQREKLTVPRQSVANY